MLQHTSNEIQIDGRIHQTCCLFCEASDRTYSVDALKRTQKHMVALAPGILCYGF